MGMNVIFKIETFFARYLGKGKDIRLISKCQMKFISLQLVKPSLHFYMMEISSDFQTYKWHGIYRIKHTYLLSQNLKLYSPKKVQENMKYLVLLISILFFENCIAQNVLIKDIAIIGNKKTKSKILLRELTFSIGDSLDIQTIPSLFESNSRYLIGTYLLSKCDFSYSQVKNALVIKMEVREAWYIYPIPIFELADRNFNVWWDKYNHDISRTNIGLQINHLNFTGRRDRLKLTTQLGFTQKLELNYKIPGINHNKTIGLFFNLYFKRSKETAYTTSYNKLKFLKEESYHNKSFRAYFGMSYRPKLRSTHSTRFLFRKNDISNSLNQDYNPNYFLTQKNSQKYLELQYKFSYDSRDFEPYPTKGILFTSIISKKGFNIYKDINYLNLENSIRWYQPLTKKFYLATFAKLNFRLSKDKIAYNQIQALGYRENQLHGYEYYVIDGEHFGFIKTSLRYKIVTTKINWKWLMPINALKVMPFELFATINNDFGYVYTDTYSELGELNNQVIWGKGIGIDMIFYTTFVFRIDYSINNTYEKGFFFHFNPNF